MPAFTLDTNVLIDAVRHPDELAQLKQFLDWALPATALSSVVGLELLAGARSPAAAQLVETELLALFERRRRVIAPSAACWQQAGRSLGQRRARPVALSAQNDLLLAHAARASGWTVVTKDRDFLRLQQEVKGLRVAVPFPARPT